MFFLVTFAFCGFLLLAILSGQRMAGAAVAAALPTRFQLPPEASGEPGGPPLEFVHWPLYSSVAFDAAALPARSELFNYLPGGQVSGAGAGATTATLLHTNMQAVRSIPRPKTFLISGIRVFVPPVAFGSTVALADDTVGTTEENIDQLDDLRAITETMALRLRIGEITFAEAPLWMMPANLSVGGVAATSVHANASVIWQNRVALSTAGIGYDFSTGRRPVLWASQNLQLELLCDWTTNPTLNDNKLLTVVLDGVMGRELQ